jgi:hypothetical protein
METTIMALTGVHIAFGASSVGIYNSSGLSPLLPTFVGISQTMASAATSTISAPLSTSAYGGTQPMLSISASAPIFYAVGPTPDPNNGPRRYMDPSFGREDIFVNPGDKFAWIFA